MQIINHNEIVIASHNQGKVKEIRNLLAHFNVSITSSADYGLLEPVEDAPDYEGNALIKARYVAKETGKIALADDSGLSVNALGGKPGIYSARWAGDTKDFNVAMNRIETELLATGTDDYSASFFCALALVYPDGNEQVYLGEVKGTVTFPPRGDKGFGYDPIFIAKNMDQTFAQISPDFKHSISHRADAFKQLTHALSQAFEKTPS
ncbi:MAG: XTP/dITP diphosphohydrolase [Alphaproteobacteria bacterium]|jgi:XTP/dITP diphosphohydrolase